MHFLTAGIVCNDFIPIISWISGEIPFPSCLTSGKPRGCLQRALVQMWCWGRAAGTHATDLIPVSTKDLIGSYRGACPLTLSHHQSQPRSKENGSSERPTWPWLSVGPFFSIPIGRAGQYSCEVSQPRNVAWGWVFF